LENNCEKLLGAPDFADSILAILSKKNVEDIEIQSKLFEILGEKGFDLIQTVYENRHHLVREFLNRKLQELPTAPTNKKNQALETVKVTSTKQIELEKRIRKESKKIGKNLSKMAKQQMHQDQVRDFFENFTIF
jgi:ATP-dependent DNA ligase